MAYPNKLRFEGQLHTFMADPDGAALGIHLRCKLVADVATAAIDGTPALQLASATERGSYVTAHPIAAGAPGACVPISAEQTMFGVCSGTVPHGGNVYGASNGRVSAASGGGAVLLGVCVVAGYDGGTCEWKPNPAAA